MAAVISLEQLTVKYDDTESYALRGIDLEVQQGEFVAILGAHGAGKTTLCLTLNGIVPNMIRADMWGAITVNGHVPPSTPVREMARGIGMVFDNPEFQMSQLTVAEEVSLGMRNLGVPRPTMIERIPQVLELVGLSGFEERSPLALSGGQQQRLAMASALAMEPDILVLDEPTTNLDPVGKQDVFHIARALNRERGLTVVVAEHEVEVIAEYADRVLVLNEGEVVTTGTPAEVFQDVAMLAGLDLRVPQVSQLAHQLHTDGRWDGRYPVTLDEAESALETMGIS